MSVALGLRKSGWIPTLSLVALLAIPTMPSECHPGPRAGLDAGFRLSTLRFDGEPSFRRSGGQESATAGGSVWIPLGSFVGITSGLRYARTGSRATWDVGAGAVRQTGEFRVTHDHLTVPLLLAVRPSSGRGPTFSVGAEGGILLSAWAESWDRLGSDSLAIVVRRGRREVSSQVKDFNMAGVACMGYEVPWGGRQVAFQVRWSHGFVDLADRDYWRVGWKTEDIEATLGVWW